MNLRKRFGLPERLKEGEMPKIMMANITVPLDLMLEIIVRQQSQLHESDGNLNGRMAANEALMAGLSEQMEHLHGDVIELQQALQAAAQHPVERVDEVTAEKAAGDDKKKLH